MDGFEYRLGLDGRVVEATKVGMFGGRMIYYVFVKDVLWLR